MSFSKCADCGTYTFGGVFVNHALKTRNNRKQCQEGNGNYWKYFRFRSSGTIRYM